MDIEPILDDPRFARALLAHRAKHPGGLSAAEFRRAMNYEKDVAALRRRRLADAGLLRLEEIKEGARLVPKVLSYLTPEGLRAADHLAAVNDEAAKARKRKEREAKD